MGEQEYTENYEKTTAENMSEESADVPEETAAHSEMDSLMEIVLNTREQCQILQNILGKQVLVKDEMIDKLHAELRGYKEDLTGRFVEQFLKQFIRIREGMKKVLSGEDWESMSSEKRKNQYEYLFEDITDLFEQQGLDIYHTEEGAFFDAAIHQPVIEETTVPELDKTVKRSLKEGYRYKGRVIVPERVCVYRYQKTEREDET